jgi:hypothetical protein
MLLSTHQLVATPSRPNLRLLLLFFYRTEYPQLRVEGGYHQIFIPHEVESQLVHNYSRTDNFFDSQLLLN